MLLLNCALKLVEELILYYGAWSNKHQMYKTCSPSTSHFFIRGEIKEDYMNGAFRRYAGNIPSQLTSECGGESHLPTLM